MSEFIEVIVIENKKLVYLILRKNHIMSVAYPENTSGKVQVLVYEPYVQKTKVIEVETDYSHVAMKLGV
jgi:hypothetical protein